MDKNSVIGFVLIAAIFLGFTVFENKRAAKYADEIIASTAVVMSLYAFIRQL